MRILSVCLMFVAAVALSARVFADEQKTQERGGMQERLAEKIADLNLSEEQEAQIAEIRQVFRPMVLDAAKELGTVIRDEVTKVRAVLTPEQEEMLQSLRVERRAHRAESLAERIAHLEDLQLTDSEMSKIEAIRSEFRPKLVNALKELHGILTDQQREVREKALAAGKSHREVWSSLSLTDEQKAKVKDVAQQLGTLLREELANIASVLTPEQQGMVATFAQERREQARDWFAYMVANLKELNLTDQQKTKIAEIRKEYRPLIQQAADNLRATVRGELKMIAFAVATEQPSARTARAPSQGTQR
jgi:Spy/CpxP family protein refolding chaperone